jgi:hypothetical protein
MKERAAAIVGRIEHGKEVIATSVVHLSEIANVVEETVGAEMAAHLLQSLLASRYVQVLDVSRRTYELAVLKALEVNISPNDALAYLLMLERGLKQIYSFDRHFDQLSGITRVE